jgi:hypothetical protein
LDQRGAQGRNVEVATQQRDRVRDEHNLSTKRTNDAVAVAQLCFSASVLDPANDAVSMLNDVKGRAVQVFDRAHANVLLARVAEALRAEMLFPEVLNYQRRLFEPSWWER